jgi:hypothetical protein
MDGYNLHPDLAKTSWSVVAGSLWLRLGVVAATGAIVALTELYRGEIGIVAALAWIFGGAWVTALSWRRGKALLDQPDDDLPAIEATRPMAPTTPEAITSAATSHPSWDRRELGVAPASPQVRG